MSQQHTTQTSGQGMLERVFKLREHGTTARTEVIAGFTTFLTMVYIVLLTRRFLELLASTPAPSSLLPVLSRRSAAF